MSEIDIVKKGHSKDAFTQSNLVDLMRCTEEPVYFIENFIKVQHPTQGSIPLKLYPFQHRMIHGFHDNRFVVGLTARQMGKSLYKTTSITHNGNECQIKDLVKLSLRERIVEYLESLLFKLAI